MRLRLLAVSIVLASLIALSIRISHSQTPQPPARVLDEARTVYLGNLARRANGVPPLRWNRQLTNAARWFSWDSVENRPEPYCGHQDTQGKWPGDRAAAFGYKGFAGAENAFCGYVTPEDAIAGWMNSQGHRDNLLDPEWREIGLGYYLRESDGRGYVTQGFGVDSVYPPVIIENEAVTTTTPLVGLYIYDRPPGGGFKSMGPASQMLVGNDICFTGSTWEPYATEKAWTLAPDSGWREVHVKTRDTLSRTMVVSDAIYLAASVPLSDLGYAQMSATGDAVTIYGLDGGGLPSMQLSLGWAADDTTDTFTRWGGNGERISDPTAWGGSAYRMYPGDGETFAWVWTTDFFKDTWLTAYFRIKVSSNSSGSEVARISVTGGGVEYGPVSLKGTDFSAANRYQEFPIAFRFHSNPNDDFLLFNFWRSGLADVTVDAVTIFTEPQPVTSSFMWNVPGGHYRGQGVWVRYTNGSQFSPFTEADTRPQFLSAAPAALGFLAKRNGSPPPTQSLSVRRGCVPATWQVSDTAAWLLTQVVGESVQVSVSQAGLGTGSYQAEIILTGDGVASVSVPVTLIVAEEIFPAYLPIIMK